MDDFSDYDRDTAETMAFRTKTIDAKKKELDIRRQQASELAAEIKKLEKGRDEYSVRRVRERGKLRQLELSDILPGAVPDGDQDRPEDAGDGERPTGGEGGRAA